MDSSSPIYVLRDGQRHGPFTIDELLDAVEQGSINYEDVCLREDAADCQRVREILEWEDEYQTDLFEDEPIEIEPELPLEPAETSIEKKDPETEIQPELDFEADSDSEEVPLSETDFEDGPPTDPGLILYAGHQSLLSFPKSLIIILLSLGCGIYFRETSGWILFLGLVLALIAIAHIMIERTISLYLITPKRVEIVKGLFAKSSNEVRISDIRTINVVRSGFLGMIGVGRVEFASSGGRDVEVAFDNVWAAHRVKGLVRRLQDAKE